MTALALALVAVLASPTPHPMHSAMHNSSMHSSSMHSSSMHSSMHNSSMKSNSMMNSHSHKAPASPKP